MSCDNNIEQHCDKCIKNTDLQWVFRLLQMRSLRLNKPMIADEEWNFKLVLISHI